MMRCRHRFAKMPDGIRLVRREPVPAGQGEKYAVAGTGKRLPANAIRWRIASRRNRLSVVSWGEAESRFSIFA